MNTESIITLQEYADWTTIKWREQGKEQNLRHSLLGIGDELGELRGNLKKKIGYGREIDVNNVLEEGGDWLFFFTRAWMEMWEVKHIKTDVAIVLPNDEHRIKTLNKISQQSNLAEYNALFSGDEDAAIQHLQAAFTFLLGYMDSFGFTLQDLIKANMAKLDVRYKEKWEAEQSLTRDRQAERTAMDNFTNNANN